MKERGAKITKTIPAVTSDGGILHRHSEKFMKQADNTPLITERMHKDGYYFFCPYCSLSFPHPPDNRDYYRIGCGYCHYCCRWIPLEGGDRAGIVRMDEQGELYTEIYREGDEVERVAGLQRRRLKYLTEDTKINWKALACWPAGLDRIFDGC